MLTVSRLPLLTVEDARSLQHRLVDAITSTFSGSSWLTRGDLGVGIDGSGSSYTRAAECVLAKMFGTEDAVFVSGAGTGAIRAALFAMLPPLSRILIHDAPVYSTTSVTFRAAGYQTISVDFNREEQLRKSLQLEQIQAVYIQHSRQQLTDHYVLSSVIQTVRAYQPRMLIIVDDNYAVANTPRIGVELGADISAFSSFKLLGPEGVGIVLCTQDSARRIRADMYSGGARIQGFQAQEALMGLALSFVANAMTQETAEEIALHLRTQGPAAVEEAYVANMQSPVVLVRFHEPIGPRLITCANNYGAAPFPVGAMSRYELIPMFYRISGAMVTSLGKTEAQHWMRINPMRAGAETVLTLMEKALKEVQHVS